MEEGTALEIVLTPEIRKLSANDALLDHMLEINDLIARRAYELFASGGFAHGHHFDDWHRAESEILHPCPLKLTVGISILPSWRGRVYTQLARSQAHPRTALQSRRQRAIPPLAARLPHRANRHVDLFPPRFLGHFAIPPARFPRFFPAGCGLYPAGKVSKLIRRTIAPNNGLVK